MSSYTVMIVWEFAWADSALVVLDEWSPYRGDHLNRFDLTKNVGNLSILPIQLIKKSFQLNLKVPFSNLPDVCTNMSMYALLLFKQGIVYHLIGCLCELEGKRNLK